MKYTLKNHLAKTSTVDPRIRSALAVALLVTSLFSSLTVNSLAGAMQAIPNRFSARVQNSQSAITCDARALSWSSLPNMPSIRMGHGSAAVGDSVIIAGGYSALNVMHPTVISYSLASNTWAAIGTIPTPRGQPGVVAIDNTLYTFGGHTSVQLYQSSNLVQSLDLSTNTWMTRSAMLSPRHNFAYALGNDSQIYVFGGETYTTSSDVLWGLSSAMVYSPTIDTWQLIAPMTFGREFAAAATGSDGRIYVTGGWQRTGPSTGTMLADVEIYDPQSNTWSSGPPLPSARLYHSAVAYGDSILVIGGDSSSGVAQSTVFEYVIGSNAWVTRTQTLSALSRASVAVTKDGQIVRTGGANGATWTASASKAIASLQWNPVPNMPDSRWGQGAAEVAGNIYVVGGVNTVSGATVYPTATHRLNLQTQTWSTVAQIPEQVQLATTVSAGGLLYVIGGYSPKTANSVNWVQVYDPTANSWYTRTAMPTARHFASGSLGADGKIYVAGGGRQSPVAFYSTVEAYDPTTDAWQTLTNMPAPRSSGAMATLTNGSIAYFGGSTGSTFVSTVYVYSPTLNTWSASNALPTVRANISAATYGNLTFILGGSTATSGASGFTRDVLAYESDSGLWQSHSLLSNSRAHISTVVGSDGYLYSISGGTGYSVGGNIVERARLADIGCLTGIGSVNSTATPVPTTPVPTTPVPTTPVPTTPVPTTPVPREFDTKFRPSSHGFQFKNFGHSPIGRAAFNIAFANAATLVDGTNTYTQDEVYEQFKNTSEKGLCYGFSAVSTLRAYNGTPNEIHSEPLLLAPEERLLTAHQMLKSTGVTDYISAYFLRQFSTSVEPSDRQSISVDRAFQIINESLDDQVPVLVGIHQDKSAHSLLAYRSTLLPDLKARVYVYDSNDELNDERYIELDLINNKWRYIFGIASSYSNEVVWSGSSLSLGVLSAITLPEKTIIPEQYMAISLSSVTELSATSASGDVFVWHSKQVITNTITETRIIQPIGALPDGSPSSPPIFVLVPTGQYTISFSTNTSQLNSISLIYSDFVVSTTVAKIGATSVIALDRRDDIVHLQLKNQLSTEQSCLYIASDNLANASRRTQVCVGPTQHTNSVFSVNSNSSLDQLIVNQSGQRLEPTTILVTQRGIDAGTFRGVIPGDVTSATVTLGHSPNASAPGGYSWIISAQSNVHLPFVRR